MIELRAAGCVLVAASCVIWTAERRKRFREHINALDTVCRFISYARREIEYFSTPFPNVIRGFDDPNGLFSANAEDCSSIAEKLVLSTEERAKFTDFLLSVGRSYPDTGVRLCIAALEYFSDSLEREKSEYPRRVKAEGSLALLVGASFALLVI